MASSEPTVAGQTTTTTTTSETTPPRMRAIADAKQSYQQRQAVKHQRRGSGRTPARDDDTAGGKSGDGKDVVRCSGDELLHWSPSDMFGEKKATVQMTDFSFSDAFRSMTRKYPEGEYRVKSALGKGRYGTVKLAEHYPSGDLVAIKFVHKYLLSDSADIVRLVRESRIMVGLRHPHVLQLYDVIETQNDILLVMEYAEGGDLFSYICKQEHCQLPYKDALRLFRQMLDALDYCHSHYVIHRDLKPENVMLDSNMNVKLGDFGFSRTFRPFEPMATSCGSLNYAAPEIVTGVKYTGSPTDIWSLGVIYYAMMFGDLPFTGHNDVATAGYITRGKFREHPLFATEEHAPSAWNPGSRAFLQQMFVVDPDKRIPMHELRRHPTTWGDKPLLAALIRPFATALYIKPRLTTNAIRRMKEAAQPKRQHPTASSSAAASSSSSAGNKVQRTEDDQLLDDDIDHNLMFACPETPPPDRLPRTPSFNQHPPPEDKKSPRKSRDNN